MAATTLTGTITYAWTGPNNFTSSSQSPVINPVTSADSGTYYVTLKLNNCTSKPDSVVVSIAPTPATPSASNNGPLCAGDTLKLSSSTTFMGSVTYAWSRLGGIISNEQNPIIVNTTINNNGSYTVIATATQGNCPSLPGSTTVSIKTIGNITSSTSTNPTCGSSNGTITLNGLTPNTAYAIQYTLNGTPASTTGTSNTTGTITIRNLPAGTYETIRVVLNGCASNASGPFTLENTSAFTASAKSNSPVCLGSALNLQSGATLAGATTYSWTGPNGFTSNMQNPVILNANILDSGTYHVIITINGCTSEADVSVIISPKPVGGKTEKDTAVCSGTNTGNILLTGFTGKILRWESSTSNGASWSVINNTTSSFSFNNLNTTTWYRALVENLPCPSAYSTITIITVNKSLDAVTFNPLMVSTCNNDTTIRFTASVANAGNDPISYLWLINGQALGVSNPFSYRFNVPRQNTTASVFTVKVLAQNNAGCGDTSQAGKVTINVLPGASINVSPSLVQQQPNYAFTFKDITATNINNIYTWDMGDRTIRSGREITYEYGKVGNYLVRLSVTDFGSGCTARDSVQVVILPVAGLLFVPNAFYPNSSINELKTFKCIATGLDKFHLQIFDTWGKLLFETTELNPDGSPKISWNGTYLNKGTPLPQDAYAWKIVEAKFKNGKDWEGMSYNGGTPKRFGTVTLFR